MRKYVPAWQRVVLMALQNMPAATDGKSAWDSLTQDEKQAMHCFVTERNGKDAEKSDTLIMQLLPQMKPRKLMPLWLVILLFVAATVALAMLALAGEAKLLYAGLAVLAAAGIVVLLCNARKARMSWIWSQRENSREGTVKALNAMYYTALRSPFAAVSKGKAALALVMLVLFAVLTALPEPAPSEAKLLADKVGEVTKGEAVMADALALLPEGLDGLEIAQRAMKYTAHGSDEEFLLAALICLHAAQDEQLMDNNTLSVVVQGSIQNALKNTAPAQINNPEETAALAMMLRGYSEDEAALIRFLKEKTLPDSVLAAFGDAMKEGRTLPQLLALCDTISAAGHDPLPFLREGVGSVTFTEGEELIASAGSEAHRALLIKSIAPAITDVDEVLAFIRLAKGHGVSAAECYPEGAAITLDTSKWDPSASARAASLGKRDTFLVIRRTEKPEPFTTIVVPEEQETSHAEELPDELYLDYDPDEELGMAQYTVTLETSVLDRMPQERIPASMADCDAVVILDARYWCDGYVRVSHSVRQNSKWKYWQNDELTFALLQEIAVYNAKTGNWLFSFKEKITNSPAMLDQDLASKDVLEWEAEDHYIAALDEAWMAETYADFLYALERRNWLLLP